MMVLNGRSVPMAYTVAAAVEIEKIIPEEYDGNVGKWLDGPTTRQLPKYVKLAAILHKCALERDGSEETPLTEAQLTTARPIDLVAAVGAAIKEGWEVSVEVEPQKKRTARKSLFG